MSCAKSVAKILIALKEAAALLRTLAKDHNDPELAEGLEGIWR